MLARFAAIASTITAAAIGGYAADSWRAYSREAGCTRDVAALREQFEERRADIRNPAPMERALSRAADLCAEGKYDEARRVIDLQFATCRHSGACVIKKRS